MEKIWKWEIKKEIRKIELTVALPALNSEKILWLALESLKNQKNIDFKWELICIEEYGLSRELIKKYVGLLPNCSRIIHYNMDPILESKYEEGKFKNKFLLIDKWNLIANMAAINSKIFVMQAADCYSPPLRLYIHYQHFRDPDCYFSTQRRGVFLNIITKELMIYDGGNIDGQNKIKKNIYENNNFYVGNHLNMALRTEDMKRIVPIKKNNKIDRYIRTSISILNNIDFSKKHHIFLDEEIDKDNWKFSLDTDGYNNISKARSSIYGIIKNKKKMGVWNDFDIEYIEKNNYKSIDNYIPKYVLDKLSNL